MFMRRRVFLWMAALCSGIGLLAAGVVSYRMPRIGEYRAETSRSEKARGLEELRKQVAAQAQTVAAAQQKLEELARNLKPEDQQPTPTTAEPPKPPMTAQELAEAGRKLAEQTRQEEAAVRVTLRERPEIPQWPVSPNILRNPAIGALAGLAVSPLLALLVGGRRNGTTDTPPAP